MNPKVKIVEAIKSLGYNSRQVSVRDNGGSTSWSFNVTIRDASVNMNAVEDAVKSCESIDRCEYSGEILCGGNTFIHVKATDEVKAEWSEGYIPFIESAISQIEPESDGTGVRIMEGYTLYKERNMYSVYYSGSNEVCGRRIADSNHIPGLALRIALNEKSVGASQVVEEEVEQIEPVKVEEGKINLIDYSEKAFAVIGDTKPIKDKLKELGGRFNFRLTCGAGWIFPKTKLDFVTASLKGQKQLANV